MAEEIIDARGLACPQPVILAKRSLESGALELEVLVDNLAASQNVKALGEKMGCCVAIEGEEPELRVLLARSTDAAGLAAAAGSVATTAQVGLAPGTAPVTEARSENAARSQTAVRTIMVVDSETLGSGSDELGLILRRSYVGALAESTNRPQTLVFINSGVKLVAAGSPVLDGLAQLAERGVEILACGTCLDYFGLKDKVAVGVISNMYNILEVLQGADKVITF